MRVGADSGHEGYGLVEEVARAAQVLAPRLPAEVNAQPGHRGGDGEVRVLSTHRGTAPDMGTSPASNCGRGWYYAPLRTSWKVPLNGTQGRYTYFSHLDSLELLGIRGTLSLSDWAKCQTHTDDIHQE